MELLRILLELIRLLWERGLLLEPLRLPFFLEPLWLLLEQLLLLEPILWLLLGADPAPFGADPAPSFEQRLLFGADLAPTTELIWLPSELDWSCYGSSMEPLSVPEKNLQSGSVSWYTQVSGDLLNWDQVEPWGQKRNSSATSTET